MSAAKVLLINNNSLARKISLTLLKKINPEFELYDFATAQELFQKLDSFSPPSEQNPIIIFSDLNMPEINGFELTSWIKRHPKYHHIPVVIVTAEDSDQEKQKLPKMGAESYCLKPCNIDEVEVVMQNSRKRFMVLGGDQEELEQSFLEESWELLGRYLQILQNPNPKTVDHYKEIYRILHTIKGVSGAVSYPILALFIHEVETLVQGIMDQKFLNYTPAIDVLIQVGQSIDQLFHDIKNKKLTEDLSEKYSQSFISILKQAQNHPAETATSTTTEQTNNTEIRSEVVSVQKNETLRIKHESLDHLQSKLKRIMQLKVQLSTFAMQLGQEFFDEPFPKQLQELVMKLESASMEALEGLLRLRARPISVLKPFTVKLVSDVATALKKEVTLEISGDEYLEIDPPIIDLLQGGLGHLVKNCIDHGIELPEERVRKGKNKYGTIFLEFKKLDQKNFQVTLKDNGKGINADKLRAVIIKNDLMNENMVNKLTPEQIYPMIFLDGLSTKEKEEVSEISGRGVGMSAVKQSIEDMGGSIQVKSFENEGTMFEIKLPLFFIL